ncbi:MAG: sigma-54 dependent transcriptional regulator [Candidatus Korobacteraceae bacterium]
MSQNRILVVDVDPVIRSGICNFLGVQGLVVCEAVSCRDAQLQLQRFLPDAAIIDFSLPNGDAPQLLRHMKSLHPSVPVLVLTNQGSLAAGAGAMQQGAEHFLVKPVDLSALHSALLRMLGNRKHARPLPSVTPKARQERVNPFVGSSAAIRRLRQIASRVLQSESPILLQGETGAGKGVLANWIHHNGPRAEQPFLDLNCAGLSRELLESELFGHEKGAFTSAVSAKQGLLEVANHGTVFLDEIGDIDLQVQPKLLKVLEDRVFRRLGEVRDRTVDIRLISATHRELLELVRQQRFRSDLYFRLNIVYIQVPPLRDRVEDIAPLARQLLRDLSRNCGRDELTIGDSAVLTLQRYAWPGNIRELRNVLERAVLMAEDKVLTAQHLHFQGPSVHEPVRLGATTGTLKQMERAYINHVLHDEAGSIERAARRLGIPRSSLYNKMKRFEIPHGTGRL